MPTTLNSMRSALPCAPWSRRSRRLWLGTGREWASADIGRRYSNMRNRPGAPEPPRQTGSMSPRGYGLSATQPFFDGFQTRRQKKLAKVVKSHLDWFDAAEARGMTWDDIAQLLSAAGANGEDEKPFTVGTLSSTVWRKREEAKNQAGSRNAPPSAAVGRLPDRASQISSAGIARAAVEKQARHERPAGHDRAQIGVSVRRAATEKSSRVLAHRKRSGDVTQHAMREFPKSESLSSLKGNSPFKAETLSYMKRAAAIRRAKTDDD